MSFDSPPAVQFLREGTADKPFVPIVGTLAADVNQVSHEAFLSDATQLANGLQRAQRLFELDVVCVVPDPSLLAEALGVPVDWNDDEGRFVATEHAATADDLGDPDHVADAGRVPVVLDAADRLITSTGDDVAVFGVLPGPQTTAAVAFGDTLKEGDDDRADAIRTATGSLARAFGRLGVDGLLVQEFPPPSDGGRSANDGARPRDEGERPAADVRAVAHETLVVLANISEFFATALTLAPAGYPRGVVEDLCEETALDAVLLDTATVDDGIDDVRVGCGLTPSLLEGDRSEIEQAIGSVVADLPGDAFLASGVEVRDVHPRTLQAVSRAVEAAGY